MTVARPTAPDRQTISQWGAVSVAMLGPVVAYTLYGTDPAVVLALAILAGSQIAETSMRALLTPETSRPIIWSVSEPPCGDRITVSSTQASHPRARVELRPRGITPVRPSRPPQPRPPASH